MSWIVLAIQESGDAENPVAVGASGIAAKRDGEQLERLFLTHRVEAVDPPKHPDTLFGDVERITVGVGTASDARSAVSRASPSASMSMYKWRMEAMFSF